MLDILKRMERMGFPHADAFVAQVRGLIRFGLFASERHVEVTQLDAGRVLLVEFGRLVTNRGSGLLRRPNAVD